MIKSSLVLLGILLACRVSFSQENSDANSWELVKKEEGLEVYTRHFEGSPIKEIKITLFAKSTIAKVTKLLSDVPIYPTWVYKCTYSERLKTVSENEFYYYIISDFPFPFSDRDLAVHSKQWIDSLGTYYSHSQAAPSMKEVEDYVHITDFVSSWKIQSLSKNLVQIDYQASSGPGGDIPVWLVNLAIAIGPSETMKNFKLLIESELKLSPKASF